MNVHQLSKEMFLEKKANGTLTSEERRAQFGDECYDGAGKKRMHEEYKMMLINRLDLGLPMTKASIKDARRYKRDAKREM